MTDGASSWYHLLPSVQQVRTSKEKTMGIFPATAARPATNSVAANSAVDEVPRITSCARLTAAAICSSVLVRGLPWSIKRTTSNPRFSSSGPNRLKQPDGAASWPAKTITGFVVKEHLPKVHWLGPNCPNRSAGQASISLIDCQLNVRMELMKILVTIPNFTEAARGALAPFGEVIYRTPTQDELASMLADCDAVLCGLGLRFDQATLAGAKKLKGLGTATTGLDHLDLAVAEGEGVNVLALRGEED